MYKNGSSIRPEIIDTTSSKLYNYYRQNITGKIVEADDEGSQTVYEWDEIKVSKDNWDSFLKIIDLETKQTISEAIKK